VRNLFLALVLANLAFAAYHGWFAPAPGVGRAGGASMPSLVLASELDVATAPSVAGVLDETAIDELSVEEAAQSSANGPPANQANANEPPASDSLANEPSPSLAAADSSSARAALANAIDATAATATPARRGGATAPLTAAAPATRCIAVGPFRELSQAATAAANLRADGLDPSQRAGEGEIWVGYWVYIEQIPSVAAAEEILGVLREHSITDSYVIPRSDSGTLISLGVFTEINRARNRREAVSELGYDVTISDRTRRATVYWIEVDLAADGLLDFEQLQPPGRIVRLEQRACEDAPL